MTQLAIPTTAPPPYVEKAVASPTPVSPASPADEYEKVVCAHDVKLSRKGRALRIGLTVANPALGLAMAMCPTNRRRTCRSCGAVVVVSKKKAFC